MMVGYSYSINEHLGCICTNGTLHTNKGTQKRYFVAYLLFQLRQRLPWCLNVRFGYCLAFQVCSWCAKGINVIFVNSQEYNNAIQYP